MEENPPGLSRARAVVAIRLIVTVRRKSAVLWRANTDNRRHARTLSDKSPFACRLHAKNKDKVSLECEADAKMCSPVWRAPYSLRT
jgi:hypothetical protein